VSYTTFTIYVVLKTLTLVLELSILYVNQKNYFKLLKVLSETQQFNQNAIVFMIYFTTLLMGTWFVLSSFYFINNACFETFDSYPNEAMAPIFVHLFLFLDCKMLFVGLYILFYVFFQTTKDEKVDSAINKEEPSSLLF
jgi:hypothetical protein